jgi:hypothetical protein
MNISNMQSDSKLLSGYLFVVHGNADNNVESLSICLFYLERTM